MCYSHRSGGAAKKGGEIILTGDIRDEITRAKVTIYHGWLNQLGHKSGGWIWCPPELRPDPIIMWQALFLWERGSERVGGAWWQVLMVVSIGFISHGVLLRVQLTFRGLLSNIPMTSLPWSQCLIISIVISDQWVRGSFGKWGRKGVVCASFKGNDPNYVGWQGFYSKAFYLKDNDSICNPPTA